MSDPTPLLWPDTGDATEGEISWPLAAHVFPGDSLELTIHPNKETGETELFDKSGLKVVFHGGIEWHLTTQRCPDPSAHWYKPPWWKRLLRRFK